MCGYTDIITTIKHLDNKNILNNYKYSLIIAYSYIFLLLKQELRNLDALHRQG